MMTDELLIFLYMLSKISWVWGGVKCVLFLFFKFNQHSFVLFLLNLIIITASFMLDPSQPDQCINYVFVKYQQVKIIVSIQYKLIQLVIENYVILYRILEHHSCMFSFIVITIFGSDDLFCPLTCSYDLFCPLTCGDQICFAL